MRLVHDISLQQRQTLAITPELRQAIAILQMSTLELDEYLQQELEENPFLELRDEPEAEEVEDKIDEDIFEAEWLDYFQDRSDVGYTGPTEKDSETRRFDNLVTRAPSLHEHLLFQANITLPEEDLVAAEFLIGCIDENGYLCVCTAKRLVRWDFGRAGGKSTQAFRPLNLMGWERAIFPVSPHPAGNDREE